MLEKLRDLFAIKLMEIVGHLLRKISATCSLFLRRGGKIDCRVTGQRRYSRDLIQDGLEIPCFITHGRRSIDGRES